MCQIFYNKEGKVEKVLNERGEDSPLFTQLLQLVGEDAETALQL